VRSWFFALVVASLGVGGCLLTTGQVLVVYDLPGPADVVGPNNVPHIDVDLGSVAAYRDHKDKLDEVNDLAILGEITNNSINDPSDVEVWMTPTPTTYSEATQVRANGILLWGALHLDRGQARRVDWDTSAGLLKASGRDLLLQEARGDGQFTLYFLDAAPTYDFTVSDAALVMVVGAGL
jgi:hypothetical protein